MGGLFASPRNRIADKTFASTREFVKSCHDIKNNSRPSEQSGARPDVSKTLKVCTADAQRCSTEE
jgi:hypothetical protein